MPHRKTWLIKRWGYTYVIYICIEFNCLLKSRNSVEVQHQSLLWDIIEHMYCVGIEWHYEGVSRAVRYCMKCFHYSSHYLHAYQNCSEFVDQMSCFFMNRVFYPKGLSYHYGIWLAVEFLHCPTDWLVHKVEDPKM
jgi:hypothetical protein